MLNYQQFEKMNFNVQPGKFSPVICTDPHYDPSPSFSVQTRLQRKTRVDPHGSASVRLRAAGCVERSERVQLQYPSGAPVCMPARTRTKTRGNPDRGASVPATKPSFLPRGARVGCTL